MIQLLSYSYVLRCKVQEFVLALVPQQPRTKPDQDQAASSWFHCEQATSKTSWSIKKDCTESERIVVIMYDQRNFSYNISPLSDTSISQLSCKWWCCWCRIVWSLWGRFWDITDPNPRDSSAFTNFICELVGSQQYLICSCVTICGVAFALAVSQDDKDS
jgi:hypothetical protein